MENDVLMEMRNGKIIKKIVCWTLSAIILLPVLHYVRRAFISDSFIVRGVSMNPTFYDGTKVYVNKLLAGARIYADYDFSKPTVSAFRLPGIRKIRFGDIVVANYPYAVSGDTISFRINYVYLKRCYGAPGDTVRIIDGHYIDPANGERCESANQRYLSETPDSVLMDEGVVLKAMQVNKSLGWTIKDFGPLYVPRRGDEIEITPENYRTWRRPVQYETGIRMREHDGRVYLGDEIIEKYQFESDWYFLGGDNVLDSRDSRYIGLFPEIYIVGIVRE